VVILGKFVRIQQKFELQHLFPSYLIMHHLSGPLPVIGSQPTTVSPSYEPQSRGNSETGVEVQTSVESERDDIVSDVFIFSVELSLGMDKDFM
jgi:hypothetical protein